MRVGIGYDAHRLVADRPLLLGGVPVPYEYGLAGHSDGDVVVHAIIDALLGAAALGDIGSHFSSDDPQYEGVSSLSLLTKVRDLLVASGWQVRNVDATIITEQPRLAPYMNRMRLAIGKSLGLEPEEVSIKATTTDGLGFTGRGEGIAAHAVASIEPLL